LEGVAAPALQESVSPDMLVNGQVQGTAACLQLAELWGAQAVLLQNYLKKVLR
jgi:hypothetical protein